MCVRGHRRISAVASVNVERALQKRWVITSCCLLLFAARAISYRAKQCSPRQRQGKETTTAKNRRGPRRRGAAASGESSLLRSVSVGNSPGFKVQTHFANEVADGAFFSVLQLGDASGTCGRVHNTGKKTGETEGTTRLAFERQRVCGRSPFRHCLLVGY